MKKIVLAFALVMCAVAANAQEYKPFKLGLGLGYTVPSDGGGGILFDIEPAYRINDMIAVGLRYETALMAKVSPDGTEGSVSGNASYTLNGIYYLGSNTFRPYVGAGFGLFSIASVDISSSNGEAGGGSEFGFYPRVGFDLGHFNVNIDYNIIGATETEYYDFDTNETKTGEIKNSYIGIRVGAFIMGGKN